MATNYSLVPVRSPIDDVLPAAGDVIKIRLGTAIAGPTTTNISSEPTQDEGRAVQKRHGKSNYHTVIVRDVRTDLAANKFTLRVWPVPAYSSATKLGYATTLEWFLDQTEHVKSKHVPMPCLAGIGTSPTPVIFGPPLYVGGYTDRVNSWVLMEPQDVSLFLDKPVRTQTSRTNGSASARLPKRNRQLSIKWKRYEPPVKVSMREARSLELYYNHLQRQPQLKNAGIPPPPLPPATSGGPPPGVDPELPPPPTGYQQPRSGRDRGLDSQQNLNDAPVDSTNHGWTLRQNSINDSSSQTSLATYTSSTSSTESDTGSDGIDPIAFARQRIGGDPMWAEMVQKWDNSNGIPAWIRKVQEACELQGSEIAV